MSQAELRERAFEVESKFERAGLKFEFKKELELAVELENILKQIDKPRPISLFDLHLHLDDMKKRASFNESQLKLDKKLTQYFIDALLETGRENNELAIQYYLKHLEISDQLYGSSSYHSLVVKINLAHLYSLTNQVLAGVKYTTEVKQLLQENRNESQLYLEASIREHHLYYHNGKIEEAIDQGRLILTLLERVNREKTDRYYDIQGRVAAQLNQQNRHKKAREHTRKALDLKLPISKSNLLIYGLLIHEYAVASTGLNDHEKAAQGFSELLRITDEIPNYSLSQRVDFMEEYVPVLRKLGRDQEAEQMEEQIKRLRFDLPLQKSRFAD